ncbi:SnoaL-like domain-containing protein [Flavivirga algicola]|uniref:Ester cyclase n=1 Tax=Flavivirga algicola TaxID=2729136 RepID=A0ABX1RZ19_9FLAO|nr:SnoaL-like domain-containing protein [Flavivirga algicola]NMH87744.1 ester cyclase [Flavivirga algicola]
MTTQEVAEQLVNYCRQGKFAEATQELYGQNIVSVEPDGAPVKETKGLEAVIAKQQQFNEMVEEIHSMEVSDPIVADKFFSCTMKMDVTFKGAPRINMDEVCLYAVEDGKIVREEFFFTPMPQHA